MRVLHHPATYVSLWEDLQVKPVHYAAPNRFAIDVPFIENRNSHPSIHPSILLFIENGNSHPYSQPSCHPSLQPAIQPVIHPSSQPASYPSIHIAIHPSIKPASNHSIHPSSHPTTKWAIHPFSQLARVRVYVRVGFGIYRKQEFPSIHPSNDISQLKLVHYEARNRCAICDQFIENWHSQPSILPSINPSMHPSLHPSIYQSIHSSI